MKLAVIIPAAGASARYSAAGGLRGKIDEDLGGRPVLQRTVELFTGLDATALVVVAGPPDAYDEFVLRHADKLGLLGVKICRGGAQHRWESVKNALKMISTGPGGCTHVAVHDAARPCTPQELIDRVLAAAEKHAAVIPGVDVPDTIKRVSGGATPDKDVDPLDAILGGGTINAALRRVEATISRDRLVLVQTPQVFEIGLLRRAYEQADLSSTDDAGLVERLGEPVVVVEGDPRNIKITRPIDLRLARQILGLKAPEGRPVHKRF